MTVEKSIKKQVFSKMAALCSRSEQCSPDIRKKIIAAGLSNEEAEEILKLLKKEKFIDDERYAKAYVTEKFKFNQWGRIKIRYNLRVKGLSDEVIEAGLELLDEEKYIEILLKTMKEKAKKSGGKSKFEKMVHIVRFVQSRGFESELINRYINEVVK